MARAAGAALKPRWIVVAAVAASLVQLLLGWPLGWLFAGWGACLLLLSVRGRRRVTRLVHFNLAALLLVFAAGDLYLSAHLRRIAVERSAARVAYERQYDRLRTEAPSADQWQQWDPDLGWTARPNWTARGTRDYRGTPIYDVRYHFDEHGLRVPPPHRADAAECLLFFGDSYTFGEGVEDDETYPWRVGELTAGRYRVYNFAMQSYGPQQMLAALESGRVERALDCTPRHVFYLWIGNHVNRVTGIEPFAIGSARYRLEPDGTLRRHGAIGDGREPDPPADYSWLLRVASRSALLGELYRATVSYREYAKLQAAVVAASRRIVESRWPRAEFHVLFWDDPLSLKHRIMRETYLRAGLELIDVMDMLPDFLADEDRHWVHPSDRHPNAGTHAQLADYLVRHVVGRAGSE